MEFSKNPLPVLDLCLKLADSFFLTAPLSEVIYWLLVIKICQQSWEIFSRY